MSARAWSQDDVAQRLRFGSGALADLPALLRELGLRRVVLMTSAGRAAGETARGWPGWSGGRWRPRSPAWSPTCPSTLSVPPTRPSRARVPTGS